MKISKAPSYSAKSEVAATTSVRHLPPPNTPKYQYCLSTSDISKMDRNGVDQGNKSRATTYHNTDLSSFKINSIGGLSPPPYMKNKTTISPAVEASSSLQRIDHSLSSPMHILDLVSATLPDDTNKHTVSENSKILMAKYMQERDQLCKSAPNKYDHHYTYQNDSNYDMHFQSKYPYQYKNNIKNHCVAGVLGVRKFPTNFLMRQYKIQQQEHVNNNQGGKMFSTNNMRSKSYSTMFPVKQICGDNSKCRCPPKTSIPLPPSKILTMKDDDHRKSKSQMTRTRSLIKDSKGLLHEEVINDSMARRRNIIHLREKTIHNDILDPNNTESFLHTSRAPTFHG